MVSPLSMRLGYGTGGDSTNTSHSSSNGSGSGQKRKLASGSFDRRENSVSGYSADREESSTSPPVVSIDFNKQRESVQGRSCPKRQKRNELQFAASSVKADLARAGLEFTTINPNKENTTALGDVSINLKGVKLVHSKDFKVRSRSEGHKLSTEASPYDYQALALACWDCYPHNRSTRSSKQTTTKVFATSTTAYSDRSTSSVSDTDSESGESKTNGNQTIIIPPLLEDALAAGKRRTEAVGYRSDQTGSCNIISSINNAVTMGEMLVFSKTPRVVTSASSPFIIVYANAAFMKVSGLAQGGVVGVPFSRILDTSDRGRDSENNHSSSTGGTSLPGLPERLLSSSSGIHKHIRLAVPKCVVSGGNWGASDAFTPPIPSVSDLFDAESIPSTDRCYYSKVCPIVARKPTRCEVTKVTHFGIEFVSGPSGPNQHEFFGGEKEAPSSMAWKTATEAGASPGDLAVGVMG